MWTYEHTLLQYFNLFAITAFPIFSARHRENANQNSSAPRTSARDCHQRNGAQSNRLKRKSNHSNNIIIIIFLHIPIGSKYHILLRFTQSRRHQSTPPVVLSAQSHPRSLRRHHPSNPPPPPWAQSPPRSLQPPAPCHRPFSSASSASPRSPPQRLPPSPHPL